MSAEKEVAGNPESGGHEQPRGGANTRWSKNWVIPLLRVLAFSATAAATLVMALDKQTKTFAVATIGNTPIKATITARFQHTPAFVFFVIANGMASLHNLLMLAAYNFDFKGLRLLLVPILDMINVALISGGLSAAVFMGQLAQDGNKHTRWNKICDKFTTYCNHGRGAMIASFIGLLLMISIHLFTILFFNRKRV